MVAKFKVGETYESLGAGPAKVVHEWPSGNLLVAYESRDVSATLHSSGKLDKVSNSGFDLLPRKRKVSVWTTVWLTSTGYAFADCAPGKRVGDRRGDDRCIRETREEVFEVEDYE